MRKSNLVTAILVLLFALGCGKGDKSKKQDEEAFRIPDSLLSDAESYRLTVDDYHVVRGGVMANAQIELQYPASEIARFIAVKNFGYAKDAYDLVSKEIGKPAEGKLVIIGANGPEFDEYRVMTRKEWWYYGVVKGDTIIFEPLDIMMRRNIAQVGITQKIAQAALNHRSGGRVPLWIRESVASRVAGENEIIIMQMEEFRRVGHSLVRSPEAIEIALAEATDREETRIAFHGALRMLENLLATHSMDNVLSFLDRLREGKSLDEASEVAFGIGYDALIDKIRIDRD